MRILIASSVFPPKILGGAELIAYNLSQFLVRRGHEVAVLTVAQDKEDELHGAVIDGVKTWRLCWPRRHTPFNHRATPALEKVVWHLQDHFDPRNPGIVSKVVSEFKPEAIQVHVMQGLGHNAFPALSSAGVPIFYFLHDLGLACFRMNMYKAGQNCPRQCGVCSFSSRYKTRFFKPGQNLHFISPSRANLDTPEQLTSIGRFARHVIPNFDLDEPAHKVARPSGGERQLIYVGQLVKTKGIDFLLNVLDRLHRQGSRFRMTVVGGGPLEQSLLSDFSNREWLTFTGKVPAHQVRSFLISSDILLLPSIWRENHPGVIREALRCGIPAMVSDAGGSKEMIEHGISGCVVKAGDEAAWTEALTQILESDSLLERWQAGAARRGEQFSAEKIGAQIEDLMSRAVLSSAAKQEACVAG